MAMNPARVLLYLCGIILVVGALWMFFFSAGLARWIPVSMLVAGILLVVGLAIMGFADRAPEDTYVTDGSRRRYRDDGDVTVIKK